MRFNDSIDYSKYSLEDLYNVAQLRLKNART